MPAAPALEQTPVSKFWKMISAAIIAGFADCGDAFIAMPR
jgi:hypothetical protein